MELERRLRRHFGAAAGRLPEPADAYGGVVRRARRRRAVKSSAVLVAVVAVALAVPRLLPTPTTVELAPAGQPTAPTATATPAPSPSEAERPTALPSLRKGAPPPPSFPPRSPAPSETQPPRGAMAVSELPAPVLAYGPLGRDSLEILGGDRDRVVWPDPVEVALPDGRGGIVLQPASGAILVWLPDGERSRQVRLVQTTGELLLRGLLPDGRVLYSVRPEEGTVTESDEEVFFAISLSEAAQPERVASSLAYESWTVGPAVTADGELVHASCHLQCSLRRGLGEPPPGAEALYQGLAIEGLTATPDGRVIGFVEFAITDPSGVESPKLVLLDGASFDELARVALPTDQIRTAGKPTVSMSADAERILVTLGSATQMPTVVATTPYLVEGALKGTSQIRPVVFGGVLRWLDPEQVTPSVGAE